MYQMPNGTWHFTFGGDCRCSFMWPTQLVPGGQRAPFGGPMPQQDASLCPIHSDEAGETLVREIEGYLHGREERAMGDDD